MSCRAAARLSMRYEVSDSAVLLLAMQADVVLVMDQDRLYTQLNEKLKVR
jgi:hypothetical protein